MCHIALPAGTATDSVWSPWPYGGLLQATVDWIRKAPTILITAEPWHLVLTVTTSGLRLTSCGEVFAPDDSADAAPPLPETEVGDRCAQCSTSAVLTFPSFVIE